MDAGGPLSWPRQLARDQAGMDHGFEIQICERPTHPDPLPQDSAEYASEAAWIRSMSRIDASGVGPELSQGWSA